MAGSGAVESPASIGPIQGKPSDEARPGIIFFNDEGTENGGLTITGSRDAQGRYRASSSWSFDQFDQDQILTLQYIDNNGQRRTGFTVADRAERNVYDLVMRRDSINAMPDTAARRVALEKLMGPVNGRRSRRRAFTWDGTWRKTPWSTSSIRSAGSACA
jgi:hypothetical protein